MLIVYSGLITLAMVIIFAALKLAEFRENGLRRAQGLPPHTEENVPTEVIDRTKRQRKRIE